jgi:ATP-dependent exoDNAse (exonuclease V) alpha subunit
MLADQGRIVQIADPIERIQTIAKVYAARPDNTIIVSPDNRSRQAINQAVRAELQSTGTVAKEGQTLNTLVHRSDMTGADREWAARYHAGDVLKYTTGSKAEGLQRGSYATVLSTNARDNTVTVQRADGQSVTYDPKRLKGVNAYAETSREFATGERVQFTAPANDLKVANRELGTVQSIKDDGRIGLKMDGGRSVSIDPREHSHLDHGYAVTSHSSQGETAARVLIHVDTALGAKDLLNNRMAYVAVSRGAQDAQIFTNDRQQLPQALGRDVSHTSAHVPEWEIAAKQDVAVEPKRGTESVERILYVG